MKSIKMKRVYGTLVFVAVVVSGFMLSGCQKKVDTTDSAVVDYRGDNADSKSLNKSESTDDFGGNSSLSPEDEEKEIEELEKELEQALSDLEAELAEEIEVE